MHRYLAEFDFRYSHKAVNDGGNADPRNVMPITIHMVHEVRQKRAMVERRSRPPATIREAEMQEYCERLVSLFRDLNRFCSAVLGCGPIRRRKYDPYGA